MRLSRKRLRQIIQEELLAEDDMSKFEPQPGETDFGGGAASPDKQKEQLEAAMATIENINASVEQLAEMARNVGWGEIKTHVPSLFPAMEDLKSFAEDLQHRMRGK